MPKDAIQVVQPGDKSGNDMVVRITLSSGRHIYGCATANFYGGDWDMSWFTADVYDLVAGVASG